MTFFTKQYAGNFCQPGASALERKVVFVFLGKKKMSSGARQNWVSFLEAWLEFHLGQLDIFWRIFFLFIRADPITMTGTTKKNICRGHCVLQD